MSGVASAYTTDTSSYSSSLVGCLTSVSVGSRQTLLTSLHTDTIYTSSMASSLPSQSTWERNTRSGTELVLCTSCMLFTWINLPQWIQCGWGAKLYLVGRVVWHCTADISLQIKANKQFALCWLPMLCMQVPTLPCLQQFTPFSYMQCYIAHVQGLLLECVHMWTLINEY